MIRHTFLILILLIAARNTWCQKMPEDYYEEARSEKFQKNDSAALRNYTYIVDHYPKSQFCSSAYYNIGNILADRDENDRAILAFKKAVNSSDNKPQSGNNLFSAYDDKPAAAARLAQLYEKMGRYDSALLYFYLYDTGFVKMYGCNFEQSIAESQTAMKYADLYLKAQRLHEAEKALLAMHVYGWGASEDDVLTRLGKLLAANEQPAALRSQFAAAVDHYYIDTMYVDRVNKQYPMAYCCLDFFGTKVRYALSGMYLEPGQIKAASQDSEFTDRATIVANLKKSALYVMIQKL